MNESQDNILEVERSLNFSQRSQGENEKIIGMSKTSMLRKALFNYVTTTKFSKILEAKRKTDSAYNSHRHHSHSPLHQHGLAHGNIGTRVLLALLINQEHNCATAGNKDFFLFKR